MPVMRVLDDDFSASTSGDTPVPTPAPDPAPPADPAPGTNTEGGGSETSPFID